MTLSVESTYLVARLAHLARLARQLMNLHGVKC